MKIGILTQPFNNNYGGIIQAYALKTILEREGHEVWFFNRHFNPVSARRKVASYIKRFLIKHVFRKNIIVKVWANNTEKTIIEENLKHFIDKNIRYTEKINNNRELSKLQKYRFDAYIVGSDQVWRPKYSPCITNYFLDFLKENISVKKIAYAASFGVDDWEFTPKQTKICAPLAKQFNAISVRESSAIKLCREYLDVKAEHVLDPTMLLTKEDYIRLIELENIPRKENVLFFYILNESDTKTNIIRKIAKELNLNTVSGMPASSFHLKASKKDLSDCVFPSMAEWLAGFRDAKFVITDSFHGAVFSIIFNKPFIVFDNKGRGNARFDSLLKLFNLESRLIKSEDISPYLESFDYLEVNKILMTERKKSKNFLISALND